MYTVKNGEIVDSDDNVVELHKAVNVMNSAGSNGQHADTGRIICASCGNSERHNNTLWGECAKCLARDMEFTHSGGVFSCDFFSIEAAKDDSFVISRAYSFDVVQIAASGVHKRYIRMGKSDSFAEAVAARLREEKFNCAISSDTGQ